MKKRWMVVASIAGIAWLAIGVWSLLSWSTWDSVFLSWRYCRVFPWRPECNPANQPVLAFSAQQINNIVDWTRENDLWWSKNSDPNNNFIAPQFSNSQWSNGNSQWSFCGNGEVEWTEECEVWSERKCITWSINPPWGVCNTKTCICEEKPCNSALDITPSSNILKHDAGNWNFGWTYRLKPGSSTFDCKWESNHIFIRGLINDPKEYYLQPLFNSSLYCGASTWWCFFIIKTLSWTVFTWNSWCANLWVAKNAGISFQWLIDLNDPSYGWKITVKKKGSYNIDCTTATRDWYTPNRAKIDNNPKYWPTKWVVPFNTNKENKEKKSPERLDCFTVWDDWIHPTCWYDVTSPQ